MGLGYTTRMKRFERPSFDEVQQLGRRLHGKSVDGIVTLFGLPARELGPSSIERRYSDRSETVEFPRRIEILGVGVTIHRLVVSERTDGKLEFQFHGRELQTDERAA